MFISLKIIGAGLILLTGYLTGIWFLKPVREHIELLEEGNYLFCLMDSGIRHRKVLFPELMGQISGQAESLWKDFFSEMSTVLSAGPDMELMKLLRQALEKYPGKMLTAEECNLFSRFGEVLLTGDTELHRVNVSHLSAELEKRTEELKRELKNRSKAVRIFCISVSMLIIIILI